MKLIKLTACVAAASMLIACGSDDDNTPKPPVQKKPLINVEAAKKVAVNNAKIALAAYNDSVKTAEDLKAALAAFKAEATKTSGRDDAKAAELLKAAKKAWLVSREPYGQTEVYRFRNSPIDSTDYKSEDGPEGAINAWPLGEALIDYVVLGSAGKYGDFGNDQIGVEGNSADVQKDKPVTLEVKQEDGTKKNVQFDGEVDVTIASTKANPKVDNANPHNIIQSALTINEAMLDNSASTPSERDVIAGYHAIEFLLWGQDLNASGSITGVDGAKDRGTAVKTYGTSDIAQGGMRPLADFTTDTYAARRHMYMEVAVDKLIKDLKQVRDGWKEDAAYYKAFTTVTNEAQAKAKLTEILTGMGTLSEGELAGERMQIALTGNSQEDEHSCFSDNTHRDIWLNAEGVSNSYYGDYAGYDSTLNGTDNATGSKVSGYGIDDYLKAVGLTAEAAALEAALKQTEGNYKKIDQLARGGQPFDVQIQDKTDLTKPVPVTIVSLNTQSKAIQAIATKLGLGEVVQADASNCNTQTPGVACPE